MLTTTKSATPFDSFNARNISPELVASTFIPPFQFEDLSKRTHNLLVGPRGSGKTTLMKMLHPSALNAWKHEKAELFRNKVDFTGIFIPSDVMWGTQINTLGATFLSPASSRLLGIAAFTTNVLEAFIDSVSYRISANSEDFLSVTLEKEDEEKFVKHFSATALLETAFDSILAIKVALKARRNKIHAIASKAEFFKEEERDNFIASHEFLHIHAIGTLSAGIELFDGLISQPDARWALLFDELEIAPDSVLQELLGFLRSTNQKLIFKLSLSPYHKEIQGLNNAFAAMQGEDYKSIPLWFSNKIESYLFSRALLQSIMDKEFGHELDLTEIFGNSDFEVEDDIYSSDEIDFEELEEYQEEKEVGIYKKGSRGHRRFKQLYETDSSFKEYIDDKQIDLDDIYGLNNQHRAQYIRKVSPLVQARLVFRKEIKQKAQSRARRNPLIYTGLESILAITEGNPRWLIGLVTSLFKNKDDKGKIARTHQAKEITRAANRFRALIKTIPCSLERAVGYRGLLSLLDSIGNHFYNDIVISKFKPMPCGSFTVDSDASPHLIEALGRALNAGAIIYIADGSEFLLGSIKGKRFRLSYLLASHNKLPLVQLSSMSLNTILTRQAKNKIYKNAEQLEIWNDDRN